MSRYKVTIKENGFLFTTSVTVEELGMCLLMKDCEIEILKSVFDGTYPSKKSLRDRVINTNRLLKDYNVTYNDSIPTQEYIDVQYAPYKHYYHWFTKHL